MIRTPLLVRPLAGLLLALTLAVGCTDMRQQAVGIRDGAQQLTDQARFCLALARTLAAVDQGSRSTVAEAAEEAYAQAPATLRTDASAVIDAIRDARDGGRVDLDDPALRAATERLRDAAVDTCAPGR